MAVTKYAAFYRLGITPWERYSRVNAAAIGAHLDRERADFPERPGSALDLGCGRGLLTPELARRGWHAVGIDTVPRAVEAARQRCTPGVEYVIGDVTDLASAGLGTFQFFLDIGCFQGLDSDQREAMGRQVTAAAEPGARLLMLAFGPGWHALNEGVSRSEVEAAYPDWGLTAAEPASTVGLGWPMNRSSPQWYRLRRI